MKIYKINEEKLAEANINALVEKDAIRRANALVACGADVMTNELSEVRPSGRFNIPVVILEDVDSGDNRVFSAGSITKKDGPIELMWQVFSARGHDGAVIVGRVDHIERLDAADEFSDSDLSTTDIAEGKTEKPQALRGWGRAHGVFDLNGVYGREAERLVREGFLTGVSADMDMFEAATDPDTDDDDDDGIIKNKRVTINKARLIAVTLVAKPAFQEARIKIEDPYSEYFTEEEIVSYLDSPVPQDGIYEEIMDDTSALAASAAPVVPPKRWFENPRLQEPTPITVTDDGQVFGHIAAWHVDHIGLPRAQKPPRSASKYAYFRTGVVRVDDGTDVPVGQLTLAGGHASMHASAQEAIKHYDDTASAVADVTVGEDEHGIWVAGALRPSVTPEQVRVLRASAPSGDWRPINGRLELVAVCQVNVPGFPVTRSIVAGGKVLALVAAGARPLAEIRVKSLEERVAALEQLEYQTQLSSITPAFNALKGMQKSSLVAAAEGPKKVLEQLKVAALREERNRIQEQISRILTQ